MALDRPLKVAGVDVAIELTRTAWPTVSASQATASAVSQSQTSPANSTFRSHREFEGRRCR